ncbi:MAG: hypothetical protein KGJ76_14890, partial [Betaproteobacteria bacterium]|nr:hypothetical protein [Betaproteobacteria bacterium]
MPFLWYPYPMLDLSILPSPDCTAGRVVRQREELLRRRQAAFYEALRGDGNPAGNFKPTLAVADALVARHAKVRAVAGTVSTKTRPGGRVVTGPSIALEIQEAPAATGPQVEEKSLLTRFLIGLLASLRAAAQPG